MMTATLSEKTSTLMFDPHPVRVSLGDKLLARVAPGAGESEEHQPVTGWVTVTSIKSGVVTVTNDEGDSADFTNNGAMVRLKGGGAYYGCLYVDEAHYEREAMIRQARTILSQLAREAGGGSVDKVEAGSAVAQMKQVLARLEVALLA